MKKLRENGIRLRRLSGILLLVALLITVAMFFAMQRTSSIYQETHEVTQNLSKWRTSAYDLQLGSDYLTEQIRCFVATGQRIHLDNYFTEVNVTKRRDKAIKELQSHRNYTDALNALRKAMDKSMDLMNREYYAAKLTILAYGLELSTFPEEILETEVSAHDIALPAAEKKELAIDYVFGEAYRNKKTEISEDMQACMDALTLGIDGDQLKMSQKLETQVFFEHLLTILLILIMLGIVFMYSYLVVSPMRRAVDRIRNEEDLPMEGAYEVRFLAKTYNLMQHKHTDVQDQPNYEATHDEQTGLYNRSGYEFVLGNVDIATSALLLINPDHYDRILEENGQTIADRVVAEVADEVRNNFRAQDYICRLDSGELAVIMVRVNTSLTSLVRKKIRDINYNLKRGQEGLPPISISVGVAFGTEGDSMDSLYQNANEALSNVKDYDSRDIRFHHEVWDNFWIEGA